MPAASSASRVAIVGGGPAGLMAAETLAEAGIQVDLYDAMPSVGRKFLLAGKGGLNITHAEPFERFADRYGSRSVQLRPWLEALDPDTLRQWVETLGIPTFVGTSGRVFPEGMKAAPLLRAWLSRLREAGVRIHVRHRWTGWGDRHTLRFTTPDGPRDVRADACILALGGASWARLGSDGAWVPLLEEAGATVAPLEPANCGFIVASPRVAPGRGWSVHLAERFAGAPLKSVAMTVDGDATPWRNGEAMLSADGIEGSLVYALSAALRERIKADGQAILRIDLSPGRSLERVRSEAAHPRGARSLASHLQSRVGIEGLKMALLRECLSTEELHDPTRLASAIKGLPLVLVAPRPLDEAISTAGGVRLESLDEHLMLKTRPGVFCTGEMLDWEAPTGGYLLTACLAAGRWAGQGALAWLNRQGNPD
ncbi:TIGR03862 family flavoprotein [Zoogloea sp.]|uniref:TIGR03862 family flavoprotein n=1 Tax=Zoogloea sp. TaxID=49181 RepID=UPI00261E3C8C|nr:TIGR03862 family flavoprotein [Zoogloea sp.]MDD3354691.1 TIGR03862 family flavoprotein [Zoogloea sp.]